MRTAAPPMRRRAFLVSVLWWVALATAYGIFAVSRPIAASGCAGLDCAGERFGLLSLGVMYGLPAMLLSIALGGVVIRLWGKQAANGTVFGTVVAWSAMGLTLTTLAVLTG